jgi:hypothetical protein
MQGGFGSKEVMLHPTQSLPGVQSLIMMVRDGAWARRVLAACPTADALSDSNVGAAMAAMRLYRACLSRD